MRADEEEACATWLVDDLQAAVDRVGADGIGEYEGVWRMA